MDLHDMQSVLGGSASSLTPLNQQFRHLSAGLDRRCRGAQHQSALQLASTAQSSTMLPTTRQIQAGSPSTPTPAAMA